MKRARKPSNVNVNGASSRSTRILTSRSEENINIKPAQIMAPHTDSMWYDEMAFDDGKYNDNNDNVDLDSIQRGAKKTFPTKESNNKTDILRNKIFGAVSDEDNDSIIPSHFQIKEKQFGLFVKNYLISSGSFDKIKKDITILLSKDKNTHHDDIVVLYRASLLDEIF